VIFRAFIFYLLYSTCVCSVASQALEIFESGRLQGVRNRAGEEVIPALYDEIGWSNERKDFFGELIGFRENNRWGLINSSGKLIKEANYYRIEIFDDEFIKASVKGSFSNLLFQGLIDKKGEVVLSCSYFDIEALDDVLVLSEYRNGEIKKGLVDRTFGTIAPLRYNSFKFVGDEIFAGRLPTGKVELYKQGGVKSGIAFDDYRYSQEHLIVKNNNQYGLLNKQDLQLLTPVSYKSVDEQGTLVSYPTWQIKDLELDDLEDFQADSLVIEGDLFITNVNGNQRVFTSTKELFQGQEVELKYASNGFLIVKQVYDGRWKLMSTSGNTIIENQDSIKFDGMYFSALRGGSWSVFNRFGRKLTPKTFDDVGTSVSNLLPVKRLNFWTLLDFQGNLLTNPRYDSILGGIHNRIAVNYLGSIGVLDGYGHWVIKPIFDEVTILEEIIFAKKQKRYFVFDRSGVQNFSIPSDDLQLRGDYIAIRQGQSWGLLNIGGEYLADPIYDEVGSIGVFFYGRTEAYVSLFHEDGTQVANANDGISHILGEREDLYKVVIDGKVGYVDAEARLRIANRYDDGGLISENRLAVKLLGRWGYVDQEEKLVIQPNYEQAFDFENGVAIVKHRGYFGLIGIDGSEVLECDYDQILHEPGRGYIFRSQEGQWGATDKAGKIILSPNYQMIRETSNGLLLVNRRGVWGIMDQKGYTRVPFQYDAIKQFDDYLLLKKLSVE
jgi:hypothetical protein